MVLAFLWTEKNVGTVEKRAWTKWTVPCSFAKKKKNEATQLYKKKEAADSRKGRKGGDENLNGKRGKKRIEPGRKKGKEQILSDDGEEPEGKKDDEMATSAGAS